jgi:copper chaperone CopZ
MDAFFAMRFGILARVVIVFFGVSHIVSRVFSGSTSHTAILRIQNCSLFQPVQLKELPSKRRMNPNRRPNDIRRNGAGTSKINGTNSSNGSNEKKMKNANDGGILSSSEPTPRTSPRYDSPTASSTSRKSPWARSSTSRGLTIDTSNAFSRSLRDGPSSSAVARSSMAPQTTPEGSSSHQNFTGIPGKRPVPASPKAFVAAHHPNSAPVISPSTPLSVDTKVPGTRISTRRVQAVGTTRPSPKQPKNRTRPGVAPYSLKSTPPPEADPLLPTMCCRCGTACICGTDCDCAEELCQCHAYQIIHSLSRPAAGVVPVMRGGGSAPTSIGDRAVWQLELSVAGMTCAMCSQAVEAAVRQALPPDDTVAYVNVSLTTDTVTMEWSRVRPEDMTEENEEEIIRRYSQTFRNAVEGIGYTVHEVQIRRVPNAMSTEGRRRILPSEDAEGHPSSAAMSVEDRWQRYRQRQLEKVEGRRSAFLWASVMTLPLMTLTMVVPFIAPNLFHDQHIVLPLFHQRKILELESIVLWALATPVQFLCGWEFYRMAWYGLRTGRTGMDLLVALGTTASYLYACYGVWTGDRHGAHFFETSAVLIAFVLAGKWMQAAAVRRTSDAITQLMELQSPSAIRVQLQHPDVTCPSVWNPLMDPYLEEIVPINEVKVGDMVKVIRGAAIPVDGIVLHGDISVDESMMTGESSPVLKTKGSVVLGGTVCVESNVEESDGAAHRVGAAFVQVTGVGSSSALAKIVQLVQQAQTRAVPIQSFADQVSAIFVPTVCAISLVTYMVW